MCLTSCLLCSVSPVSPLARPGPACSSPVTFRVGSWKQKWSMEMRITDRLLGTHWANVRVRIYTFTFSHWYWPLFFQYKTGEQCCQIVDVIGNRGAKNFYNDLLSIYIRRGKYYFLPLKIWWCVSLYLLFSSLMSLALMLLVNKTLSLLSFLVQAGFSF